MSAHTPGPRKETREELRDRLWRAAGPVKQPRGATVMSSEPAQVIAETLSDGSEVHDVAFELDGQRIRFHAMNEGSANDLAAALNGYNVCGVTAHESAGERSLRAQRDELAAALKWRHDYDNFAEFREREERAALEATGGNLTALDGWDRRVRAALAKLDGAK